MSENPFLDQLNIDEQKVLSPVQKKVGLGEWLGLFLFQPGMARTFVRGLFLGGAVIWWVIQKDFVPFVGVFIFIFLWDLTGMLYWRKKVLQSREKMAETLQKMQALDAEIAKKKARLKVLFKV